MLNPKETALKLPHNPGVYRFYDHEDTLLYVGKAKDLKNRVSSYFNQSATHNRKTQKLVSQIARIEYTLVNTEFDALLLENNLIKTHQPKYNILLKDDKTFPYICITKERFPKVLVTRTLDRSLGKFYGPYSNVKAMYTVLELVKELYTIRTCHLNLSEENIRDAKFKVCLEYHIGNCKGPCEGLQTEIDYQKDIDQVHQILKGDVSIVKSYFTEKMMETAQNLEFEKAAEYKEKLASLEKFQSKSLVANPNIRDVDVFSIISDEKTAFINYLKIKDGAIIHTHNFELKKKLDEPDEEILTLVVLDARNEFNSQATEIITNIPLQINLDQTENTIPKIGDKKKLLDLSLKNTFYLKRDKERKLLNQQKKDTGVAVLELQKILNMSKPPIHIECFDNSNIQGTNPVASMVYFQNGRPLKKEYRHFNIKTVIGPDDFSSMNEIVSRRYRRQLDENKELPDLIIIDGGKGQLNAACQALKDLNLYGQMKIIGIAKRLEEIYLPQDDIPLHIHKKSPALKLIQQARDEAHRFAIEFHRLKRSKNSIQSQLEEIKGIGAATVEKLLQHFKSIKKIKESTPEEIAEIVGMAKAQLIKESLK
ncbi:MAG: excinuclease ABC subunit UvrC [Microscillaceae bacterium]|nr:excinuclease ABC subunit UvrC [Microscillaceae bacterium]